MVIYLVCLFVFKLTFLYLNSCINSTIFGCDKPLRFPPAITQENDTLPKNLYQQQGPNQSHLFRLALLFLTDDKRELF